MNNIDVFKVSQFNACKQFISFFQTNFQNFFN